MIPIQIVSIYLESTSNNIIIVSTKYTGCEIEQYWLNADEQQNSSSNSDFDGPTEQFFFECEDYTINPTK